MHEVTGSNPARNVYFCHAFIHLFLCSYDGLSGLAKELLIPFNIKKMDFLPDRFSIINKWRLLDGVCYRRPLLQTWLLPDLNTIPNNCHRENSFWLSGYGIGFWCMRSLVRILPDLIFLPCIYWFVSLLRTLFIRLLRMKKVITCQRTWQGPNKYTYLFVYCLYHTR